VTLATGQAQPQGIVVDDTDVYWTDYAIGTTSGAVMKCARTGCGDRPTTLAAGQTNPSAVALDAMNVYWLNDDGTVMSCAKAGCAGHPTRLASSPPSGNLFAAQSLVVQGGVAYWTSSGLSGAGDPPQAPTPGTVLACPVTGCPSGPTTLATTGAASLSWELTGLALDATSVYWLDAMGGTLQACPLAGCAAGPTTLATGLTEPWNVAVAAGRTYVTGAQWVTECGVGGCGAASTRHWASCRA